MNDPEWRKELIVRIYDSVNEAKHRIKEQQKISCERIIKNISTRIFSVGEEVLVRIVPKTEKEKKETERKKLKFRWDGPWKIQDHPSETPNCYIVENTSGGKMLVNRKNVKRFIRRPEWMDNVEDLETDVEHMEEIEHLDPPIIDEDVPMTEVNKDVPSQQKSQNNSENVPVQNDNLPIPKSPEERKKDDLSRFRRWKVNDKCDIITKDGERLCGEITKISKGTVRGEKSKAWIKFSGQMKTAVYTFPRLRMCEHENKSSANHVQGIAEVLAGSSQTTANRMEALLGIVDTRDVLMYSMFEQLMNYFKEKK